MIQKTKDQEAKYQIEVNRPWCKNCRICILFCPTGVYTEDELGGPIISSPEKCTNCQLCVIRCPDFAIEVVPSSPLHPSPFHGEGTKTKDEKKNPLSTLWRGEERGEE